MCLNHRSLVHYNRKQQEIHLYYKLNFALSLSFLRFFNLIYHTFICRCYFENGVEFQYDIVPTPELLSKMLEKSPIIHVKKVRSSTKQNILSYLAR